ncbi:MAG TPA: LysR substrate-binding domain-containing protein [Xanthobacteraceae bacterium]|jgi:DNA-binding transcriptional LysR family regulator
MDTRFLETFLVAVDNGSIAEAARRLNVTAAAAAKRIHALEDEIGAALVMRSGRTIRPTEAGAAIVEHARRFLSEARDFKSIAAIDRPSGQLHLGAFQSALTGLLPDILVLMQQAYPQIDVRITRGTSEQLYRRMVAGDDLDAAIMARPPFSIPKSFGWHLLREERLVVLRRTSVSTRRAHAVLASEPFIRLNRRGFEGRLIDGYLRKHGIRPRERFEIDSIEAIAVMVDRGLGVALLPDWARSQPETLSLAKIPVPDHSVARRIGLMWPRASLRLRLVQAFMKQAEIAHAQGHRQSGAASKARVRR